MPQSEEHLAALDALGVRHGLLVITKADRADPGQAAAQASERLAGTSLAGAFFFQAEDGIQVVAVTGVQTCALPISSVADAITEGTSTMKLFTTDLTTGQAGVRSEERRVGKECRSGWWRYQRK